ncbi:hypothetical protein WA026_010610 [Henosepilachna vigintioctopunctata]|uniref:Uncharacterized protein n=1 Tax=Henosepilachna vigintioctopunctata TaxID=420089 RepID=A0AAW1VEP5_9CUCU
MSLDKTSDQGDAISNLATLFNQGLDLFNNLGRHDEPTNSLDVQCKVKKCIKIFETATKQCSHADVFSKNEGIEEVATADLQYFLLPAILGSLHLKLTSGDRRNIVEVTEIYFEDFMKRCVEYGLCKYEFKKKPMKSNEDIKTPLNEVEELTVLAKRRAVKISRYREQQKLKEKLCKLKENMENDHVDDEIKRKYFLTMIQMYIFEAIDELNSLEFEKMLLSHMEKLKKNDPVKPKKRPTRPLHPVIISHDKFQDHVWNKDSSSLQTMTVAEFYEKRLKDGIFPAPGRLKNNFMRLQEGSSIAAPGNPEDLIEIVEERINLDDYHLLEAMRQRPDLKDNDLRGFKDRINRS